MEDRGFFESLFDSSFPEFITTRVIRFLFILGIILAAIGAIALIVTGFSAGIGRGILCLILSPFIFILYVIIVRIWCELIIVVFRIADNTTKIVEKDKA